MKTLNIQFSLYPMLDSNSYLQYTSVYRGSVKDIEDAIPRAHRI